MSENVSGEIRADEKFDEESLARYLRSEVPELQGAMQVEQFHGGSANLTYALTFENRRCVLRRPPLGPVAPRSHDMRREFHGLDALAPLYPHSPRPIHLCEDEDVIGAVFFLMERRDGIVIRSEWPESLPEDEALRRRISESLIDALADLHCALSDAQERIGRAGERIWQCVAGPAAALLATLRRMGWHVVSATVFVDDRQVTCGSSPLRPCASAFSSRCGGGVS